MIDAPKLRACPLSEIKLANRAGDLPVRTLLAVAVPGCVVHRTPTRCPIFFSCSHPPFRVFRGRVSADTGNWRKRVTPERMGGGGDGGGWIFVIMKRR